MTDEAMRYACVVLGWRILFQVHRLNRIRELWLLLHETEGCC